MAFSKSFLDAQNMNQPLITFEPFKGSYFLGEMEFKKFPVVGGGSFSYEFPKLTPEEIKARRKEARLAKLHLVETMTSGVYFELDIDSKRLVLVNKTDRAVHVNVRKFELDSDLRLKNVVFIAEPNETIYCGIGSGKRQHLDADYIGSYKVEYTISDFDEPFDKFKPVRKVEEFEVEYGTYLCDYCGREYCAGVKDSSNCEEH